MIEKIRLHKKQDEEINVGDAVKYRGAIYVILNVLAVRTLVNHKNGEIKTISECLGQQYRTPNLSAEYITTKTEIVYKPEEYHSVSMTGDYIYDQETGIWVQIKSILGYRFENEKLIVAYEFEPVMELSDKEMESAIVEKRKSSMHLLKKDS